jgi:hypothetical protein
MTKNKAAQELGKLGGAKKSKAKAKSCRANGKLGGRPAYVHKIKRVTLGFTVVCGREMTLAKPDLPISTDWSEVTCSKCLAAR